MVVSSSGKVVSVLGATGELNNGICPEGALARMSWKITVND